MVGLKPIWPDAPRVGPDEPWPRYAFVPGSGMPHPIRDPEGHSYGEEEHVVSLPPERWREDEAYLRGIDLYHQGYLWEAHEAWEGIWKASKNETQRAFLRALIQTAAALIKAQVDMPNGVTKLTTRALEHCASVPGSSYMGVSVPALRSALRRMQADPTAALGAAPVLRTAT